MGNIHVEDRNFGVIIMDADFYEQVSIKTEDIPGLIEQLQLRIEDKENG